MARKAEQEFFRIVKETILLSVAWCFIEEKMYLGSPISTPPNPRGNANSPVRCIQGGIGMELKVFKGKIFPMVLVF